MNGKRYLRVVLINPKTDLKHLNALLDCIEITAEKLSEQLL